MATKRAGRVVVIGGGFAGLSAATYAARAGCEVTLLEKAHAIGGRAITRDKGGFSLNMGPHALYLGGEAERVLDELNVKAPGSTLSGQGMMLLRGDSTLAFPTGFLSLLTTSALSLSGKIEVGRLLSGIGSMNTGALAGTTIEQWLQKNLRAPDARSMIGALLMLATYSNEPAELDAGAGFRQLQLALTKFVRYVDGGWQTIVHGLGTAARAAGVEIVAGKKARSVVRVEGRVRGVALAEGAEMPADAVVIAASPAIARSLCEDAIELAEFARDARAVTAACLDVALSRLPAPGNIFALGLDRPLYYSVHSAAAKLAPEGGAVIHLARYGGGDDPKAVERELDDLLEKLQPGAREYLVDRQFLPSITVAHDFPRAARGGLFGRPGSVVPSAPGVFIAGDWIGPVGMLADASLSSGRAAGVASAKAARKALAERAQAGSNARP